MIAASNSLSALSLGWWKRASASDYVRKVGQTYAAQVIIVGLQMITTVVTSRALGPTGRGIYAVALTIGTLGVRFTTLGLHASNTYYVAKRRDLLPSMTGNTLVYSGLAGSLAGLALWGLFNFFPRLAPVHGSMLALALIWIPFGLAYLLCQNLLIGMGEIRLYNVTELVSKLVVVVLVIAIVLVRFTSPQTIFIIGLMVLAGSLATVLLYLRKLCANRFICSLSLARDRVQVGFRAYLISFFWVSGS